MITQCKREFILNLKMIITVNFLINSVRNFSSWFNLLFFLNIFIIALMFSLLISDLNMTRFSASNFYNNKSSSHVFCDILQICISVACSIFVFWCQILTEFCMFFVIKIQSSAFSNWKSNWIKLRKICLSRLFINFLSDFCVISHKKMSLL